MSRMSRREALTLTAAAAAAIAAGPMTAGLGLGADEPAKSIDFPEYLKTLKIDKSNHEAEALLVTCIDFRFFDKVAEYIDEADLEGKFDHVIIAGAELGAVVDFPPNPKLHWQQFFLEHLALAKELHKINRVIVLGHRDCGAYRLFNVLPKNPTADEERLAHKEKANQFEALVKKFHPDLVVEKFLLNPGTAPADPLKLLPLT